jgi:hypothetical protein
MQNHANRQIKVDNNTVNKERQVLDGLKKRPEHQPLKTQTAEKA